MAGQSLPDDESVLRPIRDRILDIQAPALVIGPIPEGVERGWAGAVVAERLAEARITSLEAELLFETVGLAEQSPIGLAERDALLHRLRIKRSTLYHRLRGLVSAGVVREHKIPAPRRGPNPRIFIFDPVALAAPGFTGTQAPAAPVASDAPLDADAETLPALMANRGLPAPRDLPIKGDQLAIFALPALLPSRPKPDQALIEQAVRYGNQYLQTTVRSAGGIRMAGVRDTRILAAIITLCSDRIHRQGLPPTNPWVMRVDEIIDVLNTRGEGGAALGQGGSYKSWVLEVLRRWQGTQFELKHITPRMRDYYNGLVSVEASFRFINRLHVLSWVGAKGSTPEDVCLYLDDLLIERMKNERFAYTLTLHPSMMDESNDLAYRLALWARRTVKRCHTPQHYRLDALHLEANPTATVKRFRSGLRALYADRADHRDQIMRLHGYCFRVAGSDGFAVWADPDDPLLGTRSYAARQGMGSASDE